MPGFPAEPVRAEETRAFQCPHCKLLLRDAVQTSTGVRLCLTCYEENGQARSEAQENYFVDRAVRRDVLKLSVKCKYHTPCGCTWTGTLQEWENHCQDCTYKFVECSNEGCDVSLPPGEMDHHASACPHRVVSCDYCGESIKFCHLDEHHQSCTQYPVECERCQTTMERSKVEDHQLHACPKEECLLCHTLVDRDSTEELKTPPGHKPAGVSGTQRGKRRLHLANPRVTHQHVQLLAREQRAIRHDLKALQATVQGELGETAASSNIKDMMNEWKSSQADAVHQLAALEGMVTELWKENECEKAANAKQTSLVADLEKKVEELSARAAEQSKVIARQNGLITSLHQLVESLKRDHESEMTHKAHRMIQQTTSENTQRLEQKVEDLERQSLSLKTHVSELELQLQASLTSTHNGAFLWRIPAVSRRRLEAINETVTSIYSPPFYSGRNGYKMCVRAYLNGDGAGCNTHLSLFFVVMRGEYDPLLKWPFENKVSLILVDQKDYKHIVQTFKPTHDSVSFQRPQADMNVASGCPTFAKLSVLDEGSYVKEDVMYVKCIVDTTKIYHP